MTVVIEVGRPSGVPVPEVEQSAPAARVGFQAHFVEREPDTMAIGGRLLVDPGPELDVMVIDVAVMDAAWQQEVPTEVIERVLAAMAAACGTERWAGEGPPSAGPGAVAAAHQSFAVASKWSRTTATFGFVELPGRWTR